MSAATEPALTYPISPDGPANLIGVLSSTLPDMWPYNGRMKIVNFPPKCAQVGASGLCPHCDDRSYQKPVGSPHRETQGKTDVVCNAVQCESCKEFGVVVGARPYGSGDASPWNLTAYYPLGTPNDKVDSAIPEAIASDFSEALRCRHVNAYRATAVMCRRALQASAVEQGAKESALIKQIVEIGRYDADHLARLVPLDVAKRLEERLRTSSR